MRIKSKVSSFLAFSIAIISISSGCKKENNGPDNPYNGKTMAVFNPDLTYDNMTDQEGNIYKTIKIGDKIWMTENLRTTRYNDGTAIPIITDDEEWSNLTYGAYCNYNNIENVDSIATYGRLYNWFAVGTGKMAPKGWHVATDEEWWALTNFYGGRPNAGGCLKETGTHFWNDPNNGATNISGFTALPSGSRFEDGRYTGKNLAFRCWRSEKYIDKYGICWYLSNVNIFSAWAYYLPQFGFSVRCVKD